MPNNMMLSVAPKHVTRHLCGSASAQANFQSSPGEQQTGVVLIHLLCGFPQVRALLQDYLQQFALAPVFEEAELAHVLLPEEDVVYSYVAEHSGGDSQPLPRPACS